MSEDKIGVYICSGCEIGDALDVDKLVEQGAKGSALCKKHEFLCGPEGRRMINDDVDGEGLNKVLICACSPRVNIEVFNFGPGAIVDRVNFREHVAWCHEPNDEETQQLALDYLNMGKVKIEKTMAIVPNIQDVNKDILVVGGGVAGMSAAINAAKAGYGVVLVEKGDELGGNMAKFTKQFPKGPDYTKLVDTPVADLKDEIAKSDKIRVKTASSVAKISGEPGLFDVTIIGAAGEEVIRMGSVIQAIGWKPYDAKNLEHLGYGVSPDVITNVQFEEMVAAGKIARPSDGQEPKSVVFVQCAGSRDKDHLPYCSGVCCRVSLKQVKQLHEQNPDIKAIMVYKDIRSPGQYELFYKEIQNDPAVFLTKGEVTGVRAEGGKIFVDAEGTLLGENASFEGDLVVLATGMATAATEENHALNLTYRLGPELPELKYGFPDSHFICFPYESQRTGIYAAGCVRHPMDSLQAINDGVGAALKAIQCVELVARGAAVHPRAGDLSLPEFRLSACTQCKRCTEECPFGTLDEDEKGTPEPHPNRCRRCGVCMGACPERIISFANYSVDMLAGMVKAIEMFETDEEKIRVLAFVCENDALPAFDMVGAMRIKYSSAIRIIPLRCLGSMNSVLIANAVSEGIDAIMLLGCRHGDEYQCHFIKGSELANRRMENIREALERLAIEPERVVLEEIQITDYHKIPKMIEDVMEMIEDIGQNPMKDFV
jgi:quinone-modifying oxidoreductase, subunit QmoB